MRPTTKPNGIQSEKTNVSPHFYSIAATQQEIKYTGWIE